MQQAKEEIGKLQFLGVKFFSRVRLKESRLNVHSTFTPIENPSLCIFSRNIDFPKGISSLFESDTWKEISSSLVLLSLFNLSIAKKIELYKFKDLRIFLGLIKLEYESIGFKLLSANEGDDFLENAILKALKRNEANAKSQQDAKRIIKDVINTCIGEGTMNNPEKIFVRSVLKSNDLKYDWFKVKTTSSFLGFIDNLDVVIEPDYKKKLLGEYKRIKQQYRISMKSSRNWSYYNGEIRPLVMEELARRYPRHNTSD